MIGTPTTSIIADCYRVKLIPPLQKATLLRRYKRFLADIRLPNGEIRTIHCPNTGSMRHCVVPESACWYSISDNPKRKYPLTWEIATTPAGFLAGINTHRANALVAEGIEHGTITELQVYTSMAAEVKYGSENSRIDWLLSAEGKPNCYVEVKSVTLEDSDGLGLFPDAVSTRASKHLRELMQIVESGGRAVLVFCAQHTGIKRVAPAEAIDPEYAANLRKAVAAGVEVIAYGCDITPDEIVIAQPLPVALSQ